MMSNRSRKCCWMDCSSLSSPAVWQRNQDICLSYTAGFCERQTDQGRVCKWINTVVMDLSVAGWHLYWSLCVCVCVCMIACITCGHVLQPGCMSSCLPAAQTRCRFDTWSRSWGRPLAPKANSPTRSYLNQDDKFNKYIDSRMVIKWHCVKFGTKSTICNIIMLLDVLVRDQNRVMSYSAIIQHWKRSYSENMECHYFWYLITFCRLHRVTDMCIFENTIYIKIKSL